MPASLGFAIEAFTFRSLSVSLSVVSLVLTVLLLHVRSIV